MNEVNQMTSDASGDIKIDAEHQVQIGLVRALESALQGRNRDGNAAEVLDQLKVYTNAHFLGEQLLMRLHGYADYEKHCQEHDKLLEILASVEKSFEAQSFDEQLNAFKVFADCITHHITGSDNALERFVSTTWRP